MKRILKLHFGIGAIAAALFLGLGLFVSLTMRAMMIDEVRKTVEGVVQTAVANIDTLITGVEGAVDNSAWMVREHITDPTYAVRMCHELVRTNPSIVGSTVAYVADYFPAKGRLYAPYSSRNERGEIVDAALRYDYTIDIPKCEWFCETMRRYAPHWCEPYFDDGGADIMMCTYSVPIVDASGRAVAILTADVSLANLTEHVERVRPYDDSYATLRSTSGKMLVPPPAETVGAPASSLYARVFGARNVTISGTARNGWTVELTTPFDDILRGARHIVAYMSVFSLLGLALILTVSWVFSNRLQRQAAQHQRVESELQIAKAIQTSMVNVRFPPWAAARMRPAKEVGGDRYDFTEQDGIAWFGVGDASGKGVPAALYTSLVGAGFRLGAAAGLDTASLVRAVNGLVAEHNETGMFVTAFAGRLDRATGRLEFCNAGHNPPVLIGPDGAARPLEVNRNLVMGAMEGFAYRAQTVDLQPGTKIVLYTDGVTEAMNARGELYGMARLMAFASAHAKDAPEAFADALVKSVDVFAGGAEQADDITVLVVQC